MAGFYRTWIAPLVKRILDAAPQEETRRPAGIGLALGGGFARGFAHLGVLRVLESERIPITCIAGTSVGSILGAAYASGVPLEQIIEVCRGIRLKHFSRWSFSRMGLASNERMGEVVRRWFKVETFEKTRIPLAVVATDLVSGEPVAFRTGPLAEAIRASCAYPGLFQPVEIGGRCLADGGLTAPVPTQAVRTMGARCVVGVNVGFKNWNGSAPKNMFQVVARSINAAQKHHDHLWERFADVVIEPEVRSIEWDHFHRIEEALRAGMDAALRAMPRLRELLGAGEAQHTAPRTRWTETPAAP